MRLHRSSGPPSDDEERFLLRSVSTTPLTLIVTGRSTVRATSGTDR